MNRRKAITRIALLGAGIVAATGGYKWYHLVKSPDLGFVKNSRELIEALAETIIPTTDTPGAKDAGVSDFIIMMVTECTERKSQNMFIDGLKDLQAYSKNHYGKNYQACDTQDQQKILSYFEKKGSPYPGLLGKVEGRYIGKSFFTTLKEYTVEGYCTSKPGATQGLAFIYIPGHFNGCTTMQPGQKAWATN